MYGGRRLCLYISILFNFVIAYGYVMDAFHLATVIPLVKCKNGDLTYVNNCRAIAISNSISKILEYVYVLKQTVNYLQNGSPIFSCFIDFTKAMLTTGYCFVNC